MSWQDTENHMVTGGYKPVEPKDPDDEYDRDRAYGPEPTGDWKMNQAVQKAESQEVATITAKPESAAVIEAITAAASNPNFNPDTMRALLDAHREIMEKQAEIEFSEAMARVQAALPTVLRESKNEQTSSLYAKHEKIAKAIKPIYTAEGFSITFSEDASPKDNHIRVVGILRHRAGHSERHHIDVAIDDKGIKGNVNKTLTHAEGSSQTYGRRRLTCMLFDVATGDDNDGNGAPAAPITVDQATEINDLIAEIKLPEARKKAFLKWAKAKSVEEISSAIYADAIRHLKELRDETT